MALIQLGNPGEVGMPVISPTALFTAKTTTGVSDVIRGASFRRISVHLEGVGSGNVNLEVSNDDGNNFYAVGVINSEDMTIATAMDADGIYEYTGHMDRFRLNVVDATGMTLTAKVSAKTY